ncbi:MAG: hypothetical protein JW995_07915 [Melioribacteraceae bacterium]|nr:hypothetical protein [Melioribacteraceae bacterium]
MNRIVLNIGLLLFFLAIVFFSQRQLPFYDVLLKSFAIFVFSTGMLAVVGIVFIRSINKKALSKTNNITDNISGK